MARTLSEMIASATAAVREISPVDAAAALDAGEFAAVVDVREPGEYQDLHVAGSICISPSAPVGEVRGLKRVSA